MASTGTATGWGARAGRGRGRAWRPTGRGGDGLAGAWVDAITTAAATGTTRRVLAGLLAGGIASAIGRRRDERRGSARQPQGPNLSCSRRVDPTAFTNVVLAEHAPIVADVLFFPALDAINAGADEARALDPNVRVQINGDERSDRDPITNAQTPGAATGSAHLAGHAIARWPLTTDDSGRVVPSDGWLGNLNDGCRAGPVKVPPRPLPVQAFLACVENSRNPAVDRPLRWGGNGDGVFDPVPIDDGLTRANDPRRWHARKHAMESSGACPGGTACDAGPLSTTAGECVPERRRCSCRAGSRACRGGCDPGQACIGGVCQGGPAAAAATRRTPAGAATA